MLDELENQNVDCLVSYENQWLWHKRLGHASLRLISKLKKHNLVRGLSSLVYQSNNLCEACQKGKQVKRKKRKKEKRNEMNALFSFFFLFLFFFLEE